MRYRCGIGSNSALRADSREGDDVFRGDFGFGAGEGAESDWSQRARAARRREFAGEFAECLCGKSGGLFQGGVERAGECVRGDDSEQHERVAGAGCDEVGVRGNEDAGASSARR